MTHRLRAWAQSCVQLFATPWTVASQALLPKEFSRQELEWVAISSSRDLSNLGTEFMSVVSPAVEEGSLPAMLLGKPYTQETEPSSTTKILKTELMLES